MTTDPNDIVQRFTDATCDAIRAAATQHDAIAQAARHVADTIASGGVVHLFGSGHSSVAAFDPVGRSGSLVPLNQIVDRSEDLAERLPGYGRTLATFYDQQYGLHEGETLIVVSHSGINPVGIDLALEARERGLRTVAVTSPTQSRATASRHPDGLRLFEVVDVVLDDHVPHGEAVLELPGVPQRVGTFASALSTFLIQSLVSVAAALLVERDVDPPILVSENAGTEDADRRNAELRRRYRGRLRRAGV